MKKNDIPYRFQPCLDDLLPLESAQGSARNEAEHRQGRLLGRLCGFSDYLAGTYPYFNGTDIIYLDEFLEFVNKRNERTVDRKNPYRFFRRRLESMKSSAKRGLLHFVRRLIFPGLTIRVNPIPETRVGEEEIIIADGDMSLVRDENDNIAAKHFKIDRERFFRFEEI